MMEAFETKGDIDMFAFGKPIFKIFFFHDVMFHDYDN